MSNAIVLPVVVDFDAAKVKLVDLRRTATTETTAAAKGMETALTGAEKAAERTMGGAARATGGLRDALRGTTPAVSGVMQAINVLGASAPPAIGGITNAVVNMARTGFSPLGLAIAGVVGAIGLFVSSQKEATDAANAQTEALERQAVRIREIAELREELSARQLRENPEQRSVQVELNRLMAEQNALILDRGRIERSLEDARARLGSAGAFSGREIQIGIDRDEARLAAVQKTLAEINAQLAPMRERERLLSDLNPNPKRPRSAIFPSGLSGATLAEQAALLGAREPSASDKEDAAAEERRRRLAEQAAFLDARGFSADSFSKGNVDFRMQGFGRDFAGSGRGVDAEEQAGVIAAIERRMKLERELRSIRTGTSAEVLELEGEIARVREEMDFAARTGDQASADARARALVELEDSLEIVKQIEESRVKTNKALLSDAPPARQGEFSKSMETATVRGISAGLMSGDLRDAAQIFAESIAQVLSDEVAAAMSKSLFGTGTGFGREGLVGFALQTILGSVAGYFTGGGGEVAPEVADNSGSPSGVESASVSAGKTAGSQRSYVVVVADEAAADMFIAKAGGAGSRAIRARMSAGVAGEPLTGRRR